MASQHAVAAKSAAARKRCSRLATIPQIKFEVSNYIHYEDMKSGAKWRNLGSLGGYGSLEFIGNVR